MNSFEEKIASIFRMNDEVWLRHANPLSVWTRFPCLLLFVSVIWFREWFGKWYWLILSLVLLWIWFNPRIFPKPTSTNNWASKATFGERVWLNKRNVPIPKHHQIMPNILNSICLIGLVVLSYGLFKLLIWPTLFGMILIYFGKIWFLDRMVWLYEDMKEYSVYKNWLY